jgi:hypothetical protein
VGGLPNKREKFPFRGGGYVDEKTYCDWSSLVATVGPSLGYSCAHVLWSGPICDTRAAGEEVVRFPTFK